MVRAFPLQVADAIEKLKSLHDGELAVLEVIGCGAAAVPALRELLFARERSGLFDVRRRAVEALAALGAHEVLIDFLQMRQPAADPVERLGDDAVMNAAARAVARRRDDAVFDLLMSLAAIRPLPGVIAGLGEFRRREAIPLLVRALAEDESRRAAAVGLRKLQRAALPALMAAANGETQADPDSESGRRQRRSALALIDEIGGPPELWYALTPLMQDRDAALAVLACEIALRRGTRSDKAAAIRQLKRLRAGVDSPLRYEIEQALASFRTGVTTHHHEHP
jgi:hypothetical protein